MLRSFLLLVGVFSKPVIVNQSMYSSTLLYNTEQWITAPSHCIIVGAEKVAYPLYYGKRFKLIKPLRKMYEYESDIERGVLIDGVRDISNYPDFSAQIMFTAVSGMLWPLMFKLFG